MKIDHLIPHISQTGTDSTSLNRTPSKSEAKDAFHAILNDKVKEGGVTFSQHALDRLSSRDIQLTEGDLTKLNSAVEKAAKKGARESLIFSDDMAMIVNIKNKTVITAMNLNNLKENVFTNIDSAIMI